MSRVILLVLLCHTAGCHRDATPSSALNGVQIDSEIGRHTKLVDELVNKSVKAVAQAKRELRIFEIDVENMKRGSFPPSSKTEDAMRSLSRVKHSSEVVEVTSEMQTERKVLRQLVDENPGTKEFARLVGLLQVTIDHNMEFLDSIEE